MLNQIRKILKNEEGQAIFEVMVFLPVLLYLLSILLNVGDSINASINQQKMTRGFLFHLVKNNSLGNSAADLEAYAAAGDINLVSPIIVGWRVREENKESVGAYYQLPTVPLGGSNQSGADCDEQMDDPDSNKCIRIFTLYGVCGETYALDNDGLFAHSGFAPVADRAIAKPCSFSQ